MPILNAIVFGIGDSLNPCNLSTVVILAFYLGWMRNHGVDAWQAGWMFIWTAWVSGMFYLLGGCMDMLYSRQFFVFGRYFYTGLGVVFLLAGIIHWIDWLRLRRFNKPVIWDFLPKEPKKSIYTWFAKLMGACLVLSLVALSSIWPANQFVSFYANFLHIPSERLTTLGMLVVYGLMMIVPLIASLLWLLWTAQGGWLMKNPSRTKMIVSGLLISLGFCLVYIFH